MQNPIYYGSGSILYISGTQLIVHSPDDKAQLSTQIVHTGDTISCMVIQEMLAAVAFTSNSRKGFSICIIDWATGRKKRTITSPLDAPVLST